MRKALLALPVLFLLGILGFRITPAVVERRLNAVGAERESIPNRAAQLHRHLLIADLHADTLLWNRDLLVRGDRGQVDVPRLIEGNVAVQAFTVVTKAPFGMNTFRNEDTSDLILPLAIVERWPAAAWTSYTQRALYQAHRFAQAVAASDGRLTWIRTRSDLEQYLDRRRANPKITAGFLGIEGAQALDNKLETLPVLVNAGFRMMSLAHFTDTTLAGSATGAEKGGLTAAGRELVRRMESRRIIIDLAHTSPKAIDDVLEMATRPVLVSHTGLTAVCASNRNLTDEQLRRIAARGGLIGVAYFRAAVCGTDAAAIARAIRHACSIAGVEHVAIGSDFDGAVGAPFDTSHLDTLTGALLASGFSDTDVAKIMGGNTIHFLLENLP